jgi:hypothetical protein
MDTPSHSTTLIRSNRVVAKRTSNTAEDWLPDFSKVPPVERRVARYALQLLSWNDISQGRVHQFQLPDTIKAAWEVIVPLLGKRAATRIWDTLLSSVRSNDSEDHLRSWHMNLLMQLPDGLLARLVREDGDAPIQPVVALLRNVLGLTSAETRLLDFLDNRQSVGTFHSFIRLSKGCDSEANFQRMAALLGITLADIRQVLDKKSVLSELRLIEVSGRGFNDLDHFITSSEGLKEIFLAAPASEEALRDLLIESAPAPDWTLDDFPHLANPAATLKQVLGQAARNGDTGVNALFIGPPGTGKSEFAYALAASIGLHLYRVRSSDDDGEGVGRRGRLVAYLLAQRLLQRRRDALILFDEVEDVFDGDDASSLRLLLGGKRRAGQEKGWMNRLLEENRVPAPNAFRP